MFKRRKETQIEIWSFLKADDERLMMAVTRVNTHTLMPSYTKNQLK